MAKRKRDAATSSTPRKTKKRTAGSAAGAQPSSSAPIPHLHGDIDPEKEYRLKAIIGEKKGLYLCDWEDDSETGDPYPPTWEPKGNANQLAVADWKKTKAASKSSPKRRGRPRKKSAVQSSPPPTVAEPVDGDTDLPEIGESQQSPAPNSSSVFVPEESTSQVLGTQQPQFKHLTVQVPDPPSSYGRGAYERIQPQSSTGASPGPVALSTTLAVNSSIPLPPTSQTGIPITQQDTVESTTRVVFDSQSQVHQFEDSTFRGFSPSQRNPGLESPAVAIAEVQSAEIARLDVETTPTSSVSNPSQRVTDHNNDEAASETSNDQSKTQVTNESSSDQAAKEADHNGQFKGATDQDVGTEVASYYTLAGAEQAENSEEERTQYSSASPVLREQFRAESVGDQPVQPQARPQEAPQPAVATPQGSVSPSQRSKSFDSPGSIRAHPSINQVDDYIVISAEEDPSSSLDLLTQPDYNPPPAGQRPPPSSLWNNTTSHALSVAEPIEDQPLQEVSTQSSVSFQTQLPPTKFEQQPRAKAIFSSYPTSSTYRSSSRFPSVPSQSLVTVDESARLKTPPFSTATATTIMEPINPLLAKLEALNSERSAKRKNARRSYTPTTTSGAGQSATPSVIQPASAIPANVSAEVAASQARHENGARSPSTVPASEPEPNITKEEMRTSGRLATLVPLINGENQNHGSQPAVVGTSTSVQDPELANVHLVPVSFGNIQRDTYKSGFQWYNDKIQQFIDGDDAQFSVAETALNNLRCITMHPDLVNDEAYSQPTSTPEQSQWDVDVSCKFSFLHDFLEHVSDHENFHVVVAAKGSLVPEMLDNFLRGIGVAHARLSTIGSQPQTTALRVSILDLDTDVVFEHHRADLVIAMDGACNAQDPLLQAARCSGRDNDWAILLVLVVPGTVEHVERSLLPSIANTTRVRTLLKTALKLQLTAGRLSPSQTAPKEAAFEVAEFLTSSSLTEWPVEDIGIIENLDSQTDTDLDHTLHGSSFGAGKRSLEVDGDTSMGDSGKKARVSSVEVAGTSQTIDQMPVTINPHEIELTHISDSLGNVTQSSSSDVEQLRQLLSAKDDELQEHVKVMSELQYRHEDQRVELANTKKERDEAIITAQTAVSRMTLAANQSAELRTERTGLKQALEEANSKLLNHSIPEQREFETLRLAMEQEKVAREKAEKRAEQAQKESDYSRGLYQDGSSRARELAQQNAELETRLAYAEKLATGEQARAHQASNAGHDRLLAKENRKLKAMLRDREAGLKFKDEEIARLKEAGRGRMGTRASSVPRSPRMGSPALKGRTSRQGSPTAGELKGKHLHPLRNG